MPISKEHKEILATQSASKTLPEWVDFFNSQYSKNQIYSFCYHNHYIIKKENKARQQPPNYHIKEDYFKEWSPNMAYILGLWYAVGFVYDNRFFDISLRSKDKYLLKQVAKELEYNGQLYDNVDNQLVRIDFSCKTICDDIVKISGNKKFIFPLVPKEFLPDFIRGYFDGNGSVLDIKKKRVNVMITSSSESFLETLLIVLKEETSIKSGSFDYSSCSLKFGKRDSLRLYNYMYKNNPELFLLRKKEKLFKYI